MVNNEESVTSLRREALSRWSHSPWVRVACSTAATAAVLLAAGAALAAAGDPSGGSTGTIANVPAATAGKPTLDEIGNAVGHNKIAINFVWTLFTGFLVMFMQAGFAFVETGFTRAKNAAETMMMNFIVYVIGMTGYWICGYALQMGGVGAVANAGRNPAVGFRVRHHVCSERASASSA